MPQRRAPPLFHHTLALLSCPNALDDPHDILVLEVLEQLNLAQNALRVDDVVKRARNLLNRDLLPRLRVAAGDDDAVRAVPNRLDKLVLRVDLRCGESRRGRVS